MKDKTFEECKADLASKIGEAQVDTLLARVSAARRLFESFGEEIRHDLTLKNLPEISLQYSEGLLKIGENALAELIQTQISSLLKSLDCGMDLLAEAESEGRLT